ncbi:hypothetical protein PHMEG_00013676 [Phytophthora megakarya]|uniref:CCHC-type domain-containing protein n=1 Tax=Phytophthora megakarya TaxID=4795 RepID=A0A225W7C8_9STRA|nr:hypothetical protein PHMEG_00013676 [Phytophthora megakarya]
MQQANEWYEYIVASRGNHNTTSTHAAESSDFVTLISSNLGKSVLNWYRAYIADCESLNVHKTREQLKIQLRTRFRPKDFECDLCEHKFHLKQKEAIHEYVPKFQDLLHDTELGINEMEKRSFSIMDYVKKPRRRSMKKVLVRYKRLQKSPLTLGLHITQGNHREFRLSHLIEKKLQVLPKQEPANRFEEKAKKDDWTKTAKCNNCGEIGHISPQCKKPKHNESKRYISGSVYAILEVEVLAYKNEDQQTNVSVFVDNGSSFNGVTEGFVKKLELEVTEHELMQVYLDSIKYILENLPSYPCSEKKDIVLGMVWLREQNPDVNRKTFQIKPRNKAARPIPVKIFNYYRHHGHQGRHDPTRIISSTQFRRIIRKDKDVEAVSMINPHDSEKAERFKRQGLKTLKDNPSYPILRKYADTVFRTELPSETPPILLINARLFEIRPKPWFKQALYDQCTCVKKTNFADESRARYTIQLDPVGWCIVHDFHQQNLATILPAIPMPLKEDTFDAMAGRFWYSCMDLFWGGLSGIPGTFSHLLQKIFRELRDVMRIYFDDIYLFTTNEDVSEHLEALDRLSKCQFCVDEIPCVGDFVGRNGVRMDPDEVNIIADWPVPKTKKQMESFLGTTVYVSRFCNDFAQFTGPLHESINGKRSQERILLTKDQL